MITDVDYLMVRWEMTLNEAVTWLKVARSFLAMMTSSLETLSMAIDTAKRLWNENVREVTKTDLFFEWAYCCNVMAL